MTTEFTQEELDKLPKWARTKVQTLQREHEIEKSKRVKYEALFYGEESDIYFTTDYESEIYLPSDSRVTFHVPDPRVGHDGTVIERKSAIRVHVAADGSLNLVGDNQVVIRQTSSNCVDVKVREWHKL